MATQQQIHQMLQLLDNLDRALNVQTNGYINPVDLTAHPLTATEITKVGTFITSQIVAIQTLAGQM